jgi:hypothetical protein
VASFFLHLSSSRFRWLKREIQMMIMIMMMMEQKEEEVVVQCK